MITESQIRRIMYNKSLYKFMRDFWNTCDSSKFKGSLLTEYMCECYMYSVRKFLPDKVKEDWVSESKIKEIIEDIQKNGIVYSANYLYKDKKVVTVLDKNNFESYKYTGDAHNSINYSFMREWLTDDDTYGEQPEGFERVSVVKELTAEDVSEFEIHNFFEEARDKNQHNLNLPPSHCKSKTLNVMAGDWGFSIVGIKLASLSHTSKLATDFNSQRQKIINSELWKKVYPNLGILKDTSDSIIGSHFGELYSQPYLHMTGSHMDVAVLDDLVDAHNTVKLGENLRNAKAFMQHTLPSRKNDPNNSVVWNVMQRLGAEDVTGWIMDNQRDQWSYTIMPARAVSKEIYIFPISGKVWVRDVRAMCDLEVDWETGEVIKYGDDKLKVEGDYLWAEQFGDYVGVEKSVGKSVFNTQYQQDPTNSDKSVIHEEDIQYADIEDFDLFSQTYTSHDLPFKGGDDNDLHGTVIGFWRDGKLYIDDADEAHRSYREQKEWISLIADAYPGVLQVVEDKANGPAVIDDLTNMLNGNLVPFNPGTDDKIKRLEIAQVYMKDVYFLRHGGQLREKCAMLIQRLLDFPFVRYKDIVDSFSMLVLYLFVDNQFSVFYRSLNDDNIIPVEKVARDSVGKYSVELKMSGMSSEIGKTVKYNTIDGAVLKYGDIWKCIKVAVSYGGGGTFTVIDSKTIRANPAEATEFIREWFKGCRMIFDPVGNLSGILKIAKLVDTPAVEQDEFMTLIQSGLAKHNLMFLSTCSEVLSDLKQVRWNKELMAKGERIIDYTNNYSVLITGVISATRGKLPF